MAREVGGNQNKVVFWKADKSVLRRVNLLYQMLLLSASKWYEDEN